MAMSLSGRHLGPYKMLIRPHSENKSSDKGKLLLEKQDGITQACVDLTKYGVELKYSCKIWYIIVAVVILKES
eukprot:2872811-Ditylum_brightwellii.AAC.1